MKFCLILGYTKPQFAFCTAPILSVARLKIQYVSPQNSYYQIYFAFFSITAPPPRRILSSVSVGQLKHPGKIKTKVTKSRSAKQGVFMMCKCTASLGYLCSKVGVEPGLKTQSNMAETTEQNVQPSSIQHHEVISSDMDTTKDPEHASSKSVSEGPVGMEKTNVPRGEVMSLKECCREAFDKITEYLKGELAGR